jgi:hypothetical protein
MIPAPNFDRVPDFYRVRRFRRPPVQQNKTRVAELLGNGTTRAQTAELEKKIEAHC